MFAKDEYPIYEKAMALCADSHHNDFRELVDHAQPSWVICQLIGSLHDLGYELVPASLETQASWEEAYQHNIREACIAGTRLFQNLVKE